MVTVFRCPTCKKELAASQRAGGPDAAGFPFCSVRCKTIDLGSWLSESFRIAESPGDAEFDEASEDDDPSSRRLRDGDEGWIS